MPPPPPKTISGRCVFFAKPDDTTAQDAIKHAAQIGNKPIYGVTQASHVFISLYEANFANAPLDEIERLLDDMVPFLYDPLKLSRIANPTIESHEVLRWHVDTNKKAPAAEPLLQAHNIALKLARYLDQTWHQDLIRIAHKFDPKPSRDQMSNIIDFGQADARSLYEPFILLALAHGGHGWKNPRQNASRLGMVGQFGFGRISHGVKLTSVISMRQ